MHPDDLPPNFFTGDEPPQMICGPLTMKHVVRIRRHVIRLRRLNTWKALLVADAIEAKLLSRMGWTR